ncbi:TonB-dependent receptor [Stenotrophomonas sp. SY1]|uniref:TonB-dependent receptor plug domain-containing protein n=1 Tax=Stenotrophomonas sp. SY1 TaxID=477235 RepID=UPI001E36C97D|nr:TonB-dependent receptor [Stenotrophomonas sp. SY1]MCD9085249.1 TonB-dependent receptor [Stenotrophomonas sp. SY1]
MTVVSASAARCTQHTSARPAALPRAGTLAASLAVALWGSPLLIAPAMAQSAGSDDAVKLDTVMVTGSRLIRTDLDAPSPTTMVTREDIQAAGSATIETVLNEFPQLAAGNTSSVNNGGGSGVLTANLRGLGANRTLTLVNGRRFMPADSDGVVDLASIPDALIENVEIVTGGASAVYGSDAIAGAVNFIMRKNFSGIEAAYTHGQTSEGDGAYDKYDITLGGNFADDRGNAVISFSRTDRDPVLQGARDFSKVPLDTVDGKLVPGGSGSIPGTRIGLSGSQLGSLVGVNLTPAGECSAMTGIRFGENGTPLPYCNPQDAYNYAAMNYLQRPLERTQVTALANYKVNDAVEAYAEVYYSDSANRYQQAPDSFTPVTPGAGSSTLLVPNFANNPVLLPAVRQFFTDNAHIFDPDGDGTASIVGAGRRADELGPRYYTYDRVSRNLIGGLRGDFEVGGGHWWRWDAFVQEQHTRTDTTQNNMINQARLAQALNATVDSAGNLVCVNPASGCVPASIFGLESISPGSAAFLTPQRAHTETFDRNVVGATLSGSLFDLPAGSVAMAFGAEYRKDEYAFQPSAMDVAGEYGAVSQMPMAGEYSVKEVFTEFRVPLLSGARFAQSLAIEGAARYSDYSTIGGVNTWKVGLEWSPTDWMRFRSAYNVAIRAPSLNELYSPQARGFTSGVDPCTASANPSAAQQQLCIQQGVPAADLPNFSQGSVGFERTTGGNPNLTEEKSDTFTVGAVFSLPQVDGLNFAVDYFQVDVEDAITSLGANQMLSDCFSQLDPNSTTCRAIIRLPNGQIDDVRSTLQNIGKLKARGLDFQTDYRFNVPWGIGGNDGNMSLTLLTSWLFERSMQVVSNQPALDCAGYMGGGCGGGTGAIMIPDFKLNFTVGYKSGPLSVRLQTRMIDSFDLRPGLTAAVNKAPRVWYVDSNAIYDFNETVQLFAGIDNLLNKQPPILGTGLAGDANTDVGVYDVLGRRYNFGIRVKF